MTNPFFDRPILNSPYECPEKHWELDGQGQPTQQIIHKRRPAEFITPIPKPRKRKTPDQQQPLDFGDTTGISTEKQRYDPNPIINAVRNEVARWRALPDPAKWQVTPETALLLQHWRSYAFSSIRPFFCQVEAVETVIWLTEVAPNAGKTAKGILEHLANANHEANPDLMRLALKLATGAGKTTVMAMIIAWQTVNAVRRPQSRTFSRGFLIVTPGITIKDRLRVLLPNDTDSYYAGRELVPPDMVEDVKRAKIVITNYHAFKLRERIEMAKGGRSLLQGRGEALNTLETEGQMIQRVMNDLMGMKNIMVINDEAHHCYREKQTDKDVAELKGDEKAEADKNREAARLWISGLEAVNRKLGLSRVMDLSATPFFLSGSGYVEGTLFPWTMSDFSLMDAIECGIVKLPRVPVADNIPGADVPMYRNLWEHIRAGMPKKGRGSNGTFLDPLSLPTKLQTALEALYGHYEKTYRLWQQEGIAVPPCFIVVCNNTATSKLVYDFISGYYQPNDDGSESFMAGRLEYVLDRIKTGVSLSWSYQATKTMTDCFHELTDSQWQIIEKILDDNRKRWHSLRTICNAILWINRTGAQWRELDKLSATYPPWQTVYYHFRQFKLRGIWEELLDSLVVKERQRQQRKDTPSLLAIDSQSVKIMQFISEQTGIDGHKLINGRKRSIAVDRLGLPWSLAVTSANTSDNEAGRLVIDRLKGKVPRLKMIAADHGYKVSFVEYVEAAGYQTEIVQKPESSQGFVPEKNRWPVERSFGWLNFRRRLFRDVEKTVESSEAMLRIAFVSFLINRLTE